MLPENRVGCFAEELAGIEIDLCGVSVLAGQSVEAAEVTLVDGPDVGRGPSLVFVREDRVVDLIGDIVGRLSGVVRGHGPELGYASQVGVLPEGDFAQNTGSNDYAFGDEQNQGIGYVECQDLHKQNAQTLHRLLRQY